MTSLHAKGFALALALIAGTVAACAENRSSQSFMSEAEMSSAFGGKTIDGQYADGTAFTESYGTDGRISYQERGRDMAGRWLVRGGAFCTLYDTSPTGGCFRVVKKSANCFEFFFVARDEVQAERGPGLPPSWTAQAWIKGQRATCKDEATV